MTRTAARLVAALAPDPGGPTDADLLARFVAGRDAGAFELLVWRHAGLVLRVCRGVVRDRHAAEDVAQAVFLALARQAGTIRGANLPGWLFRVARRLAARTARRRRAEPAVADLDLDTLPTPEPAPSFDPAAAAILHDELARLPEAYRAPVLLCFFGGLTQTEAARRLGWPVGTVAGRMARAKARLAVRLARRGLTPAVLAATGFAVPAAFAGETARAAVVFVTHGRPAVSEAVLALVRTEVRAAAVNNVLRALGVVGVVAGCGALAFGTLGAADPPPPAPAAAVAAVPVPPAATPKPKAVIGTGFAVVPVTTDLQRRLTVWRKPSTVAVVLVDGTAVFKDKLLDPAALDLPGLQKAVAAYPADGGRAQVEVTTHYVPAVEDNRKGRDLLDFALEGVVRRAGFGVTRASQATHPGEYSWADYTAPLKDADGADAAEAGVGDERATAYPVRTPLSRMWAGGVAGVVDVRPLIDTRVGAVIPAEVEKSIAAALAGLKLPKGKRVSFLLNTGIVERDGQTQKRERTLVDGWAAAHGLEAWGITH